VITFSPEDCSLKLSAGLTSVNHNTLDISYSQTSTWPCRLSFRTIHTVQSYTYLDMLDIILYKTFLVDLDW